MAVYKRVLLKLSGEALKTGNDLFDFDQVHRAAAVIRKMADMGTQIGIVIGAGNIWRGRQGPAANMDAVTADQMGMLGTVINCLCMADALRQAGVDAVVMSAVDMNRFCEPFNAMTARRYLSEGRVVLFAAGSGNPFFSTDTTTALRAVEVSADIMFKATMVDGVYDKDPHKYPDAKKYDTLTFTKVLEDQLAVMDGTAATLCRDNKLPILVFDLADPDNIARAVQGENVGTLVYEG